MIGICSCEGYGFQAVYSGIGYINQRGWVENRVSFSKKLINWLKILARLGKPGIDSLSLSALAFTRQRIVDFQKEKENNFCVEA